LDRDLALRLIHPWRVGGPAHGDIVVVALSVDLYDHDHRKDCIRIGFSSGLQARMHRRTGGDSAFETAHFAVTIDSSEATLSAVNRELMGALKARIEQNEGDEGVHPVDALVVGPRGDLDGSNLWLIPGHLGNALDLSVRTLRVLQSMDLLLIESGSGPAVEQLFERYGLGDVPPLYEIRQDQEWIRDLLDEARSSERVVGVFGANEGAPGLCDPGWRVLAAAERVDPPLKIRSVSGGSALTTALMHSNSGLHRFSFVGTFEIDGGSSPFIRSVQVLNAWSANPTLICFADGESLRRRWDALRRAASGLEGTLTLIANVSLDSEYTVQHCLQAFPKIPVARLHTEDKVVVRLDMKGTRSVAACVWRALMLPWSLRQ